MPDEDIEWLEEHIGKGKISAYINFLVVKNKDNVILDETRTKMSAVLNYALLCIGLSFIALVLGTVFFPGVGPYAYIVILSLGGILLCIASSVNIWKGVKNGTRSTISNGRNRISPNDSGPDSSLHS